MAAFRWSVGAWGFLIVLFMGACAPGHLPKTIYDDPVVLANNRVKFAMGCGPKAALAELRKEADEMLKSKPRSVMDKSQAGPSGDMHDYVSYAPYYWADPKDSHAPYVSHDGQRNEKLVKMGNANDYKGMLYQVHTLGLAYYYTGEGKYAEQAAKLARVWFLDRATRMNPNFEYAQAIPNLLPGRGIGLIENRGLAAALDGLTLIRSSKYWSDADDRAMREWVAQFDVWLTTSKNGMDEKNTANNHGSWYVVDEAGLALYLGKTAEARAALEGVKWRIIRQIQPDGRQPLEIAREDGYGYSVFNLMALTTVAELGRRNGVDLWHFELDNRCIQNAIDYMMPFAIHQKKWTDKQLHKIEPGEMVSIVYLASKAYGDGKYRAWLASQHEAVAASRAMLTGNN